MRQARAHRARGPPRVSASRNCSTRCATRWRRPCVAASERAPRREIVTGLHVVSSVCAVAAQLRAVPRTCSGRWQGRRLSAWADGAGSATGASEFRRERIGASAARPPTRPIDGGGGAVHEQERAACEPALSHRREAARPLPSGDRHCASRRVRSRAVAPCDRGAASCSTSTFLKVVSVARGRDRVRMDQERRT